MLNKLRICYLPIHPSKSHLHEELSICLIEGGSCTIEIYNENHIITDKTLLIIPAQVIHKCTPTDLNNWKFRILFINKNLIKNGFNTTDIFNRFNYKKLNEKNFTMINSLFTVIENNLCEDIFTIKPLKKILSFIDDDDNFNFIDSKYKVKENIQYIKKYLNRFYLTNPTLDKLSSVSNLSKYYIVREFEKLYGISPHKYIISKKIALAQDLLDNNNDIADVAIQLGFYDQSHFSKFFKQYTGISPKKYLTDYK